MTDSLNILNHDFNIWHNTYDPNFIEICQKSNVPERWVLYQEVLSGKYSDSIIKPINSYAENLYPFPTLVSINDKTVKLRQHTHAEILLLETDGNLKALDRPWLRQFYQSLMIHKDSTEVFQDSFVAYSPWFIDESVEATVSQIKGSPFLIQNMEYTYRKHTANERYIDPIMVPFRFKNVGPHMKTKYFGKIKKNTPIFDITFEANGIIIEKIRNFYEKRN